MLRHDYSRKFNNGSIMAHVHGITTVNAAAITTSHEAQT